MTQPVDGGFVLFVYLQVPLVLYFLSTWFPVAFEKIAEKVAAFSFFKRWGSCLLFLCIHSLLIGSLLFIPYGLEAGVWRKDGCPYFFSNSACVDWWFENRPNG